VGKCRACEAPEDRALNPGSVDKVGFHFFERTSWPNQQLSQDLHANHPPQKRSLIALQAQPLHASAERRVLLCPCVVSFGQRKS